DPAAGPRRGLDPAIYREAAVLRDRTGVVRGCSPVRAADGPAGIRRARSWAPRVPGDRSPPRSAGGDERIT
ncbi:hypothetical protein, partial [Mycobacterium sp. 1165178.9]|uniref:hypothetical protein n=1 Tax=Mycobacterium sp. 1165178.9 TaxID=1834070 RepID=UPI001E61B5DE